MKEIILSELVSADEIKGQQGSIGVQGRPGPQGEKGVQGSIGVQGRPGPQGEKGIQGSKGDKGNDGTGIAIKSSKDDCRTVGDAYIDLNGDIMIMQSDGTFINGGKVKGPQGDKGDPGPAGQSIKGDQGPKGAQGSIGATPVISTRSGDFIDFEGTPSVETVENGTNTILLEFNYLKGARGVQGLKGEQGNNGVQGLKGDQGARGVQGLKGDQGPKGDTPSTSNFVTTDGEGQIISGSKYFTGTQCKFKNFTVFEYGAGMPSVTEPSDIRFKTNITPITNVLEDILKVDVFNYDWVKNDITSYNKIGISAQQFEELGEPFSKLVHIAEDEDETRSVEYTRISIILIKAIQEQQKIINNLENRINVLENK